MSVLNQKELIWGQKPHVLIFCRFSECFKSFTAEQDATLLVGLSCGEATGQLSDGNRILGRECRSHTR